MKWRWVEAKHMGWNHYTGVVELKLMLSPGSNFPEGLVKT